MAISIRIATATDMKKPEGETIIKYSTVILYTRCVSHSFSTRGSYISNDTPKQCQGPPCT